MVKGRTAATRPPILCSEVCLEPAWGQTAIDYLCRIRLLAGRWPTTMRQQGLATYRWRSPCLQTGRGALPSLPGLLLLLLSRMRRNTLLSITHLGFAPYPFSRWADLAVWASQSAQGPSDDGSQPAACTPSQSYCLVHHVGRTPSAGPAAESPSAGSKHAAQLAASPAAAATVVSAPASGPAAERCCAGSARPESAAARARPPLPACEQPLLPPAISGTGGAPTASQPPLGRWAADADAATTAARRQRQRARQPALAQSAAQLVPVPLGGRCVDLASQLRAAAAAASSALPEPAQPAVAPPAPAVGAEAMLGGGGAIVAQVPGVSALGCRCPRCRLLSLHKVTADCIMLWWAACV